MKNSNTNLWTNVEGMAVSYANEMDSFKKETIVSEIFEALKKYTKTSVNNAWSRSNNFGLAIPKEDFESRFMEALWTSIEAYTIGGSTFKNIVARRFKFAEIHTSRQYKTKGDESDKNGVSYESARWDSLDRKAGGGESEATLADVVLGDTPSAEVEFLGQNEEMEIVDQFAKMNERYATVIRFMALGYEGDALAIATGESDKNDAKMRKLVQRAKESFGKFMEIDGE